MGRICTFNVIDDFDWEGLCVDVDFSIPSARVFKSLEQVFEWRGKPKAICCDDGAEYISTIEEAQTLATKCLGERLHSAIEGIPPVKILVKTQNYTL